MPWAGRSALLRFGPRVTGTSTPGVASGNQRADRAVVAFVAGAVVGVLGGLIGLGGAEFRLPLLIGVFGFAALSAVILNKAMSLIVVAVALPARLAAVPFSDMAP